MPDSNDNLRAEPGTVSGEAQQTQCDPSAVPSPEGGSLVPPPSGDGPIFDLELYKRVRVQRGHLPDDEAQMLFAFVDGVLLEAEALRGENARLLARLSDLHDQRCDLVDRTVGQLVDGDLGPSERLFMEMLERVLVDGKRLLDARHRLLHAVEREWTQGRGSNAR